MLSTSSMRKSLCSLAIFWTNSDRIISVPYIYLTRGGKTRAIRSLPAPMRVDPSQRGREITMNQGGVKISRVDEKGPPRDTRRAFPFVRRKRRKDQSFLPAFSASPRMSPSDAPESDEPYCATACFSSAICNALPEKLGFFDRSKPMRSAERRVGTECVSTFKSWWAPVH